MPDVALGLMHVVTCSAALRLHLDVGLFARLSAVICTGNQQDDAGLDALDECAADDSATYKLKLSKWYQGTFDAIQNPIFWMLLQICRCLRSPLRHFFAFVQKRQPEGETLKALITEKLEQLNDEFMLLHRNMNDIVKRAMEFSGCDKAFSDDPETVRAIYVMARKLCFQQWASFQRRIFFPLQQNLCSCYDLS